MASGSDDGWRGLGRGWLGGELSGCVDAGGEGGFSGRRGRGNITLEGFRWMRGGGCGGFLDCWLVPYVTTMKVRHGSDGMGRGVY